MASAVLLGSSKLARKNRAVFERPQPASPAYQLRVPKPLLGAGDNGDNWLVSSLSTPHFTFTSEDAGGTTPPLLRSEAASDSPPALPSSRARPSPLTLEPAPSSPPFQLRVETLDGCESSVSLLGLGDDLPRSPSSAGLGKDWRQMQVKSSPTPS